MFQSVGPGELFTIAIVALIVFGPHRLPDIARKVGGYVKELRAAAADIRRGLDAEVQQLKGPIEAVTEDLTKPISEVKQTLSETADAVKLSTDSTSDAVNATLNEVRGAGKVEWVGPQPKTGVSPGDAWEGMNDEVPNSIADPSSEVKDPPESSDDGGVAAPAPDEAGTP